VKARQIACSFLLSFLFLDRGPAQQTHSQKDVHWCAEIPSIPVLQEAKFSAVYGFEITPEGRPVKIQRVSVPFISKADGPLTHCIASWHLPPSKSKATATFLFEWGWRNLVVHSGDLVISIPAHTSAPVTR